MKRINVSSRNATERERKKHSRIANGAVRPCFNNAVCDCFVGAGLFAELLLWSEEQGCGRKTGGVPWEVCDSQQKSETWGHGQEMSLFSFDARF